MSLDKFPTYLAVATFIVRASLDGQPQTKVFLENAFGVDFAKLAK